MTNTQYKVLCETLDSLGIPGQLGITPEQAVSELLDAAFWVNMQGRPEPKDAWQQSGQLLFPFALSA